MPMPRNKPIATGKPLQVPVLPNPLLQADLATENEQKTSKNESELLAGRSTAAQLAYSTGQKSKDLADSQIVTCTFSCSLQYACMHAACCPAPVHANDAMPATHLLDELIICIVIVVCSTVRGTCSAVY